MSLSHAIQEYESRPACEECHATHGKRMWMSQSNIWTHLLVLLEAHSTVGHCDFGFRVCWSVWQCVAVRCSVVLCVAVHCSVLQCVAVWCRTMQCDAVRCSVLRVLQNTHQCLLEMSKSHCLVKYYHFDVYVCCSALHCVALCCGMLTNAYLVVWSHTEWSSIVTSVCVGDAECCRVL